MKSIDILNGYKGYIYSEKGLSNNTCVSYLNDNEQFLKFVEHYVLNGVQSIDADIIDSYILELYENKLAPKSILRKISSISSFLKYLHIEGIINENPINLIARPRTPDMLPKYFTVSEIEIFLNSFNIEDPCQFRDKTLFELMYSCGLRVSEATTLTVNSVFHSERLIKVLGKGDKERLVPVGDNALILLREYINTARAKLLNNKKSSSLFLNYRGESLTRKGIWKNLKKQCRMLNLNINYTVHTLRHSFATHLIQNGADIRGVQALMGHSSINSTEIYTHLDMRHLESQYNKYHIRNENYNN